MYDALIELTELSCVLQDWNTAIDKAERTIRRTIYRFTIMKDKPGTQMLKAMMSIKDMQHGSVPLNNETRHVHFNHRQFLSSLIDNMNARLFKPSGPEEKIIFSTRSKFLIAPVGQIGFCQIMEEMR